MFVIGVSDKPMNMAKKVDGSSSLWREETLYFIYKGLEIKGVH